MSKFYFKLKGVNKLAKLYEDAQKSAVNEASKSIFLAGLAVEKTAKELITDIKGSRQQTRYNPKRTVTVSDVGDAPNADTGRLHKSIRTVIDKNNLTATVSVGAEYGAILEKTRPFLRPALLMNREYILQLVEEAAKKVVKK